MRALELQRFGLDGLVWTDRPSRPLGPREVRIETRAASLNYRDLLVVLGAYNPKLQLPIVPLSDGVGRVVEVGSAVTRVQTRDRVAPIFAQRWLSGPPDREKLKTTLGAPLDGVLRAELVLDEDGLVKIPESLSDVEAATLPCAGVTAWNALRTAKLGPGQTLVVQGTGGVALFALQIAKIMGAEVIVTSKSDHKLSRAKALGADHTLNYAKEPQWGKAVKQITGGRGADVVLELGGAATFSESLRAVAVGGHVSLIGNLGGGAGDINLVPVLMQNITVQGVIVGSRESFEELCRAVLQHHLHPVIDRVFPFAEAPRALEALGKAEHFGKIALVSE